ncbi:MAG: hypothetical protein R3E58_00995 [Phycisphaerae bacterium]
MQTSVGTGMFRPMLKYESLLISNYVLINTLRVLPNVSTTWVRPDLWNFETYKNTPQPLSQATGWAMVLGLWGEPCRIT